MINAVVIAVILMIVLCLCRLNVVISLFISALVGGLISGMSIEKVINVFGKNIVDGAEVALSYTLLGGFAKINFIQWYHRLFSRKNYKCNSR